MAAQTYATESDVRDILSDPGTNALIDDNETRQITSGETLHITNAIERSAVRMNRYLQAGGYDVTALSANAWCKWCNATLAALHITRRGLMPSPEGLVSEADDFLDALREIGNGETDIPQQARPFDTVPTVTNFTVQRGREFSPVRVIQSESTGDAPTNGILRRTSGE